MNMLVDEFRYGGKMVSKVLAAFWWIFTSPDDRPGFSDSYPGQWLVPFFYVSHFQEEMRSLPRS